MARCCEARQDHQQAAEWFAYAAGQAPEKVALWNALGAACVRCGKLAAAHQAFTESYQRDPAQESVAAILREIESLLDPVATPAVAR
jgi:predicted TPR repeat methyltransferase